MAKTANFSLVTKIEGHQKPNETPLRYYFLFQRTATI
jgi:hypothetical protein